MNRLMPLLAIALSGCAATAPRLATFTDAVPVRLDFADGACRFWYTDHGSNSSQLQQHLAGVANKSSRVEFWTDGPSHETCLLEGVAAANRAGFETILIRPMARFDDVGEPPR